MPIRKQAAAALRKVVGSGSSEVDPPPPPPPVDTRAPNEKLSRIAVAFIPLLKGEVFKNMFCVARRIPEMSPVVWMPIKARTSAVEFVRLIVCVSVLLS